MMKHLKIKNPIIQAPMAGGITTSNLVAEVSNAGGLGMIGAGYQTPIQTREQIREIKQLTSNPFGINLFVPNEFNVTPDAVQSANQLLHTIRKQLNLEQTDSFDIPDYKKFMKASLNKLRLSLKRMYLFVPLHLVFLLRK